ncbi:polysaccharide deacetylase family protein [Zongyangia hominis]|uniref:Polysaccharide deacetylase family protein n=1 Tax=Zongyangia hominis TaxID=2763677 RepID=A0A926ECX7_9FIRM|nr:polysaccharide deacetylase family protein [Zongyangia hominis]MBC8569826.1 polysaccharide deacetylase family protein [Zongyangia hominis]
MNFTVVTKKKMMLTGCVILLGIAIAICIAYGASRVVGVAQTNKDIPIYSVDTLDKKVALTFNCAWDDKDIDTLLGILKKYNAQCTFFVVGQWCDAYPESVKKLVQSGHEVMSHSDTHADMAKISEEKRSQEIDNSCSKIERVAGVRPTLFRVPSGSYNSEAVRAVRNKGLECIQWDVDSIDWKKPGADKIVERVTGKVRNGSIVLFHSGAPDTPTALPQILQKLSGEGYTFVKVSDLIYPQPYTLDHEGRQHKAA